MAQRSEAQARLERWNELVRWPVNGMGPMSALRAPCAASIRTDEKKCIWQLGTADLDKLVIATFKGLDLTPNFLAKNQNP